MANLVINSEIQSVSASKKVEENIINFNRLYFNKRW